MKKNIPFISPLLYGFLGGLLIDSIVQSMGIAFIPGLYVDFNQVPPLLIFLSISILSAILIAIVAFINISYLVNIDDKRKAKLIAITEILVCIALLFICWNFWNPIFRELSIKLTEIYKFPPKVYA